MRFFNDFISRLTFFSFTLAYSCVVVILVCPSILLTDSIGTSFSKVTVVANVCLAVCVVRFLVMPHKSAISFKYAFIFWLLFIGNSLLLARHSGCSWYLLSISIACGSNGTLASIFDFV